MSADFPADADGDALRRVPKSGSDIGQLMTIDFSVSAPDEAVARRVAAAVEPLGFDPSLYENAESGAWSVYCSKSILATHQGVLAVQAQLNELAQLYGAHCDGWAGFGN